MKIALVLATSTGGVGKHVVSLVEGLTAAGHRVVVFGPRAVGERFGFPLFRPVEISAGPHPKDALAVWNLRAELRAMRPDVVHAHGLRAGLVASLAGARPLVVSWHNQVLDKTGPKAKVLAALERVVARRATLTLGVSDDLVARVLELGGRDVRLAPVGAPPLPVGDGAAIRKEYPEKNLILSVGRLHPQKGYDTLVAAARRWPDTRVLIAGSGPAEAELRAAIDTGATGTRAPVTLLGHRDDVADLLAAADVAVVTSVWEARQLFAQEALRAGVPLVATKVGGLPGLLGDGAALIAPGDVDALDRAVTGLLDDPDAAARLVGRGRARAATWPSEADTVAQAEACYRELTGS
ncbi:glycosyl transferase [Longispora fulva]|uniref:Glycosyltransferase involved in cell wall biosynthesis n=1 Tax=Longispora fulva TaxID=619741 RepID=A0A8J7KFJ3_9ACTN|nr:glycosyltransferase family 4 protein [Longispora fulva]MBG6133819.1 glycosyltransferase involved in cell wall biosynthesis [Longispora fulva]GIG62858.1 glycosyl transferase [Longispora fulva]